MMHRFLMWISGRLPCRLIDIAGAPYLERYHLASLGSLRIYLHRFVGSDPDREFHDHPWYWALSLILCGWYIEHRRTGPRPMRWINALSGDTFHRVELPAGQKSVWTMFIHGQRGKRWGFLREVQVAPHRAVIVYEPYTYADGAQESGAWWITVPRGRDAARQP